MRRSGSACAAVFTLVVIFLVLRTQEQERSTGRTASPYATSAPVTPRTPAPVRARETRPPRTPEPPSRPAEPEPIEPSPVVATASPPTSAGPGAIDVWKNFERHYNESCLGEWRPEFLRRQMTQDEGTGDIVYGGVSQGGISDMLRGFATVFWLSVALSRRFHAGIAPRFFKGTLRVRSSALSPNLPAAPRTLSWIDRPRFHKKLLSGVPKVARINTNIPDASAVVGVPACIDCWTLEEGHEAPRPLARYRGADTMHLRGCAFHTVFEPTPDFADEHRTYRAGLLGHSDVGGGRVVIALHARLQTPSDARGYGGGASSGGKPWMEWAVSWFGRKTNCKKMVDDMLACGKLLETRAKEQGAKEVLQVWLSDNPQTQTYIKEAAPYVRLPKTGPFCHSSAERARHCSAAAIHDTIHEFLIMSSADYVVHSTGHFSTSAAQVGFVPHENIYSTWEGRPIAPQIVKSGPQLCEPLSVRMQMP